MACAQGRKSYMLRLAVLTLESLAADTRLIYRFLGLPEAADNMLPKQNQSSVREILGALSAPLPAELVTYSALDVALRDAAVVAGGALLAPPSRLMPIGGL